MTDVSADTPDGAEALEKPEILGADGKSHTNGVEHGDTGDYMSNENVEPYRPAPLIAIMGEVAFAGRGVAAALREAGFPVRVLCDSESTELALKADGPSSVSNEDAGAECPPASTLHTIRGTADSEEHIKALIEGAEGLVVLSPVNLDGRGWDADDHLGTVKKVLGTLDGRDAFKLVYLSTLTAESKSQAKCVREAVEAENLVAEAPVKSYILRAGPLVGRGDAVFSRIADRAARAFPFMLVWGYGDTTLQPLHVADLGRCIGRAFKSGSDELRPGVYSVAGTETVNMLELMDLALNRMGRFKLKFHIPEFILRLLAMANSEGALYEKVQLMSAPFYTDRNDAPSLLGPHHGLRNLSKTGDEIVGVR